MSPPLGSLGALPTEIRIQILLYILKKGEIWITFKKLEEPLHNNVQSHVNNKSTKPPVAGGVRSLMLTCKEFNNLATPILYGENTFYFPEPFNDLAVFLLQLRPASFHAIRNVKIQLDFTFPTEGLDILCASNSLTTLQLASKTPISISKRNQKVLSCFRLRTLDWECGNGGSSLENIRKRVTGNSLRTKWEQKRRQETRQEKVNRMGLIFGVYYKPGMGDEKFEPACGFMDLSERSKERRV